MLQRLRSSILKYGFIQNLVVRRIDNGYEVLSGNQRLKLLRELNLFQSSLRHCRSGMMPNARLLAQVTEPPPARPMTWDYGQNLLREMLHR